MTALARTPSELDAIRDGRAIRGSQAIRDSRQTGVVMTMGALHAGHARLIEALRADIGNGLLIVTDFVNPTQFAAGEDFDRYPRTLDADREICAQSGADVVFVPTVEDVYPAGPVATMDAGWLGSELEGAARPGHFDGMLTVVSRFMDLTGAAVAAFGEKDYQQLVLVEQMAARRTPPVRILRVPTVREADGLAMSSRNRYLSANERAAASSIPRALTAAAEAAVDGVDAAIEAGISQLDPSLALDYLVVRDPQLGPVQSGPARVLIAARAGSTRLLDNLGCEVGA